MALSEDPNSECPLCMEPFEMDDFNFYPCTCGYQICRFCWHRIRTDENGLCPACRKQYPEDPADFKPLSAEELQRIKCEKRQKDQQKKQKLSENRKHLANVRVVQKNLVFVLGLPNRLSDAEVLKKHDYFGKFGKIHKVVVNRNTTYAGSQGPSASAYVTYCRPEDALRSIQCVNNIQVDGRTIRASLGTTKYCSHFLKNQQCQKTDCMYLHELGDEAASFTKEDMQQGKHQEYEKRLQDQILGSNDGKHSSSPLSQNSASSDTWLSTTEEVKEQRGGKFREIVQGHKHEKPNRSKGKHGSGDGQRSKRGKSRSFDSIYNGSTNKSTNKEEFAIPKKNQKPSRHMKDSLQNRPSSQAPLQRVNESTSRHGVRKTHEFGDMHMKNAHTTYVEITEKPLPNHLPGKMKVTRSGSPSLPPSPASSSSSSLFTPFGSLSSNFLSSSPSPPPSNSSQTFQVLNNKSNSENPNSMIAYTAMSDIEHNHQKSPSHFLNSLENNESLFCHLNDLPVSNDLNYYSNHLPAEDEIATNDEVWNSCYSSESPKQPEDDLDFDPWDESSKGLADLVAKEATTNSCRNSNFPPGFSSTGKTVSNNQRLSAPPPGFNIRQYTPSVEVTVHPEHYYVNSDSNNKVFISEKRQTLMEAMPNLYHQSSHGVSTHYYKPCPSYNPCDASLRMREMLRAKRQISAQENSRATFPNINANFGVLNPQRHHNQNGPMWNSSGRELPWLCNEANFVNSGNISEGQRGSAQYMMRAFQQLNIEESLNTFSGHPSYSTPYTLQGQWPLSSQCPPPGFVTPSRSPGNVAFQHMPVNQQI